MAEIFALSLLRHQPLAALRDPHGTTDVDGRTRFALSELLCELRNLPWWDGAAQTEAEASGPWQSHPHQRWAQRCNVDGQLTLRTLFSAGLSLRGETAAVSALWDTDHVAATPDPTTARPSDAAPMSEWATWCARASGAGLRWPDAPPSEPVTTLDDMTARLYPMAPARPFHNAALAALSRGAALDAGLQVPGSPWDGARVMALMAQAEALARRVALCQAMQSDRLPRPVVTAARMTVWLAHEERAPQTDAALYRAAAEELAQLAPNLLAWVSRSNRAHRGAGRFDTTLFLPLSSDTDHVRLPEDLAVHGVVAGALATVLKAVFDTSRRTQFQTVGAAAPSMALGEEVDRLVANICLARCVSGAYHPAENDSDIRLGQAVALHALRDVLERENRSAGLSFTDFDGRLVDVRSHPRHLGRGTAEIRLDHSPVAWPQDAASPAAHLTAVV